MGEEISLRQGKEGWENGSSARPMGQVRDFFLALTATGRFIYRALIVSFEGSTLVYISNWEKWLAGGI